MKKIFITRKIPDIALQMLREKGCEVSVWPKETAPSQKNIISELKNGSYDAVICLLTDQIDEKVFDAAPTVKIFANFAAGYNNIAVAEAKKRGITVTNTPGVSAKAVAEHALALMLSLTTRATEGDRYVRAGKYKGWAPNTLIGEDLSERTVGLVGVGAIGSEVARMAHRGFDARVIYYDVAENKAIEEAYGARRAASIEELLQASDVISLHVPLLDSTRHLINAERLSLMKPSAFLINTSRGPVVDENALVEALKSGKIRGAGLDVYEFEPKLAKGLSKLENVVLTPHIASARESVRAEMAKIAAQNIIDFFDGKTPKAKVT